MDKPVSTFDGNVITFPVFFFNCFVKQSSLDFRSKVKHADLTSDWICHLTTVFLWVCNYWHTGLFLSGLVCSCKVVLDLVFYWETSLPGNYDIRQPSSKITLESYLPWYCFWHNYINARNIALNGLMWNVLWSEILNVSPCDQWISYKCNYKVILSNLS